MSARTVRRPLLVVIALLVATLGGATIRSAAAQTANGIEPGIVATGYGRASGPASSAEVQLIVSRDVLGGSFEAFPSFSEEGQTDIPASPVAGDDETVVEIEGDSGAIPGPTGMPSPLTEEDVAPIVDALAAAGVPADQISVLVPNASSSFFTGIGGPQSAEIRFTVDDPVVDDLASMAESAQEAAFDAGLNLVYVGATYHGEDCAALAQQAREAAVEDARARAEGLAEALGVELGDLIQAADGSFFFGPSSLDPSVCISQIGLDTGIGPGINPPFDPAQPAEIVIISTVTLTFAIGGGDATA
jgi:hypothetical protein